MPDVFKFFFAFVVVLAMTWICGYLGAYGLIGLRLWNY